MTTATRKNHGKTAEMTKKELSESIIRALKEGTEIASGKKSGTPAREFTARLRAEVEEDKRERR